MSMSFITQNFEQINIPHSIKIDGHEFLLSGTPVILNQGQLDL